MSATTWFRLLGLSFVLAMFVLVAPAWTQAPAGKKVALLVGVRQYKRDIQFPELQYTENDVVKLAEILRSPAAGFSVRLLTTTRGEKNAADAPTAANIRKALQAMLEDRSPRDTVLVALSGHGVALDVEDPDGKGKNRSYSYFCPSDADLGVKPSYSTGKNKTFLNLQDLFSDLGLCGAGVKLVLMDACRNELKVKKESSTRSLNAESVTIPRGVGALFSCSAGQFAYEAKKLEHGVFFHFVLEGLDKARNDRKEVTWSRLVEYVTEKVADEASSLIGESIKQTPHPISNITGKSPVVIGPGMEEVVKGWGKQIKNDIGMTLMRIPPGKFEMGSPTDEKARNEDEKQHDVEITKEFWLGIHEVTQKQFKDVMGYNPSSYSAGGTGKPGAVYRVTNKPAGVKGAPANTNNFPVENVSWEEADEFCKKLTSRPAERGRKYRLPTEAEWEYACRGGVASHQVFHFGNSLSSKQANFDGNEPYGLTDKTEPLNRTCEVGSYEKNGFGLYDMHGNVLEWCADWYHKDYYGKSPLKDPMGPSAPGSFRIIRGGAWFLNGPNCRTARRAKFAPTYRGIGSGFRLALVPSRSR